MTSMLQRFILAATLALLAGCSTLVPVPDSAPATPASAQSAWSRVLARFVDETFGKEMLGHESTSILMLATACAAIPSPRPVKPSRSVVVALMLT